MDGQEKIVRCLEFLLKINTTYGVKKTDVCVDLGISESTFRRYIDSLRQVGFDIVQEGHRYRIDDNCHVFKKIAPFLLFSDAQKHILYQGIHTLNITNQDKEELIYKIQTLRDTNPIIHTFIKYDQLQIIEKLKEAIENKCVVVLKNYSSSHSATIKDRTIEPFRFGYDFKVIWGYDLDENFKNRDPNKTFKLLRIDDMEIVPNSCWTRQRYHKAGKIDIFGMTAEHLLEVTLQMTQKAKNLLLEETNTPPQSVSLTSENTYIALVNIAQIEGLERFVMGLWADIKIISPEHIRVEIEKNAAKKFSVK